MLRLQVSRGRTPCPVSTWPWFTSSSNMPACLSDLIKGQNNSNSSESRVVKRPCSFCKVEHLEGIFRRQMSKAKISGASLPGSCGEGSSTGLWVPCLLDGQCGREEQLCHYGPRGLKPDRIGTRAPSSPTCSCSGTPAENIQSDVAAPTAPTSGA